MLAPIKSPRRRLRRDASAVGEAAARLRIPEFAFFHLAYRRWFGEPASDSLLEPLFVAYLYRGRVPLWVRHLARQVLAREGTGAELSAEFDVQPILPPVVTKGPAERLRGLALTVFYTVCFALFTWHAL